MSNIKVSATLNPISVGVKIANIQTLSVTAMVAGFTQDVTEIEQGETVTFTDTSTNDPTGWYWDFGDGGTSTLQNPTHTYTAAGTYTVELRATKDGAGDIHVKTNLITVTLVSFTPFEMSIGAPDWYVMASTQAETDGVGTLALDGEQVVYLRDQSNSFDFVQLSGSAQPTFKASAINGEPSLVFNGSSSFMENVTIDSVNSIEPNGAAHTLSGMIKFTSLGTGGAVFVATETNGKSFYRPFRDSAGSSLQYFKRDLSNSAISVTYFNSLAVGWHYFVAVDNGTTIDVWVNGVKELSAANSNVGALNLNLIFLGKGFATSQFLDGEIAEMFLTSGAATDQDVADLNDFYQTKYNVT